MDTELHLDIVAKIGEDMVFEIYAVAGDRPVFFSAITRTIIHGRIKTDVQAGMSLKDAATKHRVSVRTVRRLTT